MLAHTYCIFSPILPHITYCQCCLVYIVYCLMYIAYFYRHCLVYIAGRKEGHTSLSLCLALSSSPFSSTSRRSGESSALSSGVAANSLTASIYLILSFSLRRVINFGCSSSSTCNTCSYTHTNEWGRRLRQKGQKKQIEPWMYGVATISRRLKIIGLFCKRAL